MGKFKNLGDNFKLSDIVAHYTAVANDKPTIYNLSDFYKGGRYIIERKDSYACFPYIPDDTKSKRSIESLFETGLGTRNNNKYLKVRLNSIPKKDDIIQLYDLETEELLPTNLCPKFGTTPARHRSFESLGATPKFSSMTDEERGVFNMVYYIAIQANAPSALTQAGYDYSKIGFILNAGDATGKVTSHKDRFNRCKTTVLRADNAYKNAMGFLIDNPSSSIPVEIPEDDDGTEIKFSDFAGGYGRVRESVRTTAVQRTRSTDIDGSRQTTATRQTAKSTRKTRPVAYTKQVGKQTSYTTWYGVPGTPQPYYFYYQVSAGFTKQCTYTPATYQYKRPQCGGYPCGDTYEEVSPGFWTQTFTYQSASYEVGPLLGQTNRTARGGRQTSKSTNSTKQLSRQSVYYQNTSKGTSWNTTVGVVTASQTSWQSTRNTTAVFWD
jgi:hypothetical protein